MFEQMRSDLAARLKVLMNRFDAIVTRADHIRSDAEQAQRLGLPAGQTISLVTEIFSKADQQLGLCGESITLLLVNRSLPLMFKRDVSKAEDFAKQCEARLNEIDHARQTGREAFRSRFAIQDE
ncbi:hypothetical protein [Sphingomonas sp. OK281]|uniref:hypothetical protein n=1 Tax=Sphingomonas sp. OK281 TaxID=1881067 RepID=UPI000B883D3F|nr:hypothetical protein [Sphingomonas sp. OK281]